MTRVPTPAPREPAPDFLEEPLLIFGPEPPVLLVEERARRSTRHAEDRENRCPNSPRIGLFSMGAITTTKGDPCDTTATFHVATSPPVPGDARREARRALTGFTGCPSSRRTLEETGGDSAPKTPVTFD